MTAKVISRQVPREAYMRDPTASQYGMFRMVTISSGVMGDWEADSLMFAPMGEERGCCCGIHISEQYPQYRHCGADTG